MRRKTKLANLNLVNDLVPRDDTVTVRCYNSERALWLKAARAHNEGNNFSEFARDVLTMAAMELLGDENER